MGSWAFRNHTSGIYNTAIGNYAMGGGTSGNYNTALGANLLQVQLQIIIPAQVLLV